MARHFLGRLRNALFRASKRRCTHLNEEERADLHFWKLLLQFAHKGLDMCSLTYREPTIILRSDACEHGLGGYCLNTGRAWRLEIPEELRNRATSNSLEFLAGDVAIEMEQLHGNLPRRSNVLSCGDSTTAAGWLQKSNFNDECPLQLWIARHLALMVITAGATVHSHWFPGKENNISDCCSRDHHLSDGDLTNLLYLHFPDQMPPNFIICPVPPEVSLRITTWLHKLPPSKQSRKVPIRSEVGSGVGPLNFLGGSNSCTTHSSMASLHTINDVSSVPTSMPTVLGDFPLLRTLVHEHWVPFATPSTLWWRPLGLTNVKARPTTEPVDSISFFNGFSKVTRTMTPVSNHKKH
jgi:hypothetical protein